jgi:hypothetical protein
LELNVYRITGELKGNKQAEDVMNQGVGGLQKKMGL